MAESLRQVTAKDVLEHTHRLIRHMDLKLGPRIAALEAARKENNKFIAELAQKLGKLNREMSQEIRELRAENAALRKYFHVSL